MTAHRFGRPPPCPVVHTNIDDFWLALALVAEMPGGIVPIGHAMLLAHGGEIFVPLDADEQRAVRAWKRAVQPRRRVPGALSGAIDGLVARGLVDWTEIAGHKISPEGEVRLDAPDFAWWRWEAALFAPIARRVQAWCAEGRTKREADHA